MALIAGGGGGVVGLIKGVLAAASFVHWETWDKRETEELGAARIAHVVDLTCMGVLPISLALRAAEVASWGGRRRALTAAVSLAAWHLLEVRRRFDATRDVGERDKKFNKAFGRVVLVAVGVLTRAHGVKRVAPAVLAAAIGSAIKLGAAYKRDGGWRGWRRGLDFGTAFFHLSFGFAIREVGMM